MLSCCQLPGSLANPTWQTCSASSRLWQVRLLSWWCGCRSTSYKHRPRSETFYPRRVQHSQHGLLTMVFIAIPMGAKDRLRILASGLAGEAGFHCLLDLSINTRPPHMLSAKTLQSSGLGWASCSSTMTLSRALGGTMILLPHSKQPSCKLSQFLNHVVRPTALYEAFHLGQEWMTICQFPDLGSWDWNHGQVLHQMDCLWGRENNWGLGWQWQATEHQHCCDPPLPCMLPCSHMHQVTVSIFEVLRRPSLGEPWMGSEDASRVDDQTRWWMFAHSRTGGIVSHQKWWPAPPCPVESNAFQQWPGI